MNVYCKKEMNFKETIDEMIRLKYIDDERYIKFIGVLDTYDYGDERFDKVNYVQDIIYTESIVIVNVKYHSVTNEGFISINKIEDENVEKIVEMFERFIKG